MTEPVVLDASAVLAMLLEEPGAEAVVARLDGAVMASVNLAEVLGKLGDHGIPTSPVALGLDAVGLDVVPVQREDARMMADQRARERALTGRSGLSLADHACLAVAARLDRPALTADRAWADLDLGVEVVLIR